MVNIQYIVVLLGVSLPRQLRLVLFGNSNTDCTGLSKLQENSRVDNLRGTYRNRI